jgi:hypothetical protein
VIVRVLLDEARKDPRVLLVIMGIGGFILFVVWEPDALRAVVKTLFCLCLLGLSPVTAYHSFDALRSALNGTNGKTSAPSKDPSSLSARFASLFWASVTGLVTVLLVAVGFFGPEAGFSALIDLFFGARVR